MTFILAIVATVVLLTIWVIGSVPNQSKNSSLKKETIQEESMRIKHKRINKNRETRAGIDMPETNDYTAPLSSTVYNLRKEKAQQEFDEMMKRKKQ